MKRAVIISGGNIETDFALCYLEKTPCDLLIAADRGLVFLNKAGMKPTHIVGDFDSAGISILCEYVDDDAVEIRQFQPEKDWTDTEIAVQLALDHQCEEIIMLGCTGSRIDHVLGSIQTLALIEQAGVSGYMIDQRNRISVRSRSFSIRRDEQWGTYVSLFAYGGDVQALSLQGFKYEVHNFQLGTIGTRTVSNEITAETGRVDFASGKIVLIESND